MPSRDRILIKPLRIAAPDSSGSAARAGTDTFDEALARCAGVGTGWQLPNIKELQTIVDETGLSGPAIDEDVFVGFPQQATANFLVVVTERHLSGHGHRGVVRQLRHRRDARAFARLRRSDSELRALLALTASAPRRPPLLFPRRARSAYAALLDGGRAGREAG
jgi:hypothetical protein